MKRCFFLFLGMIMMIMMAASAVSAQDIDITGMDNAQLTALLQQILSKLQQEEASETEAPAEEPPAAPAVQQPRKFTIWENKKLSIEALPGYMFVPKVTEEDDPDPVPGDPGKKDDKYDPTTHTDGEPCTGDGAHWYFLGGEWRCMYG